jgi:hypothetical protein
VSLCCAARYLTQDSVLWFVYKTECWPALYSLQGVTIEIVSAVTIVNDFLFAGSIIIMANLNQAEYQTTLRLLV